MKAAAQSAGYADTVNVRKLNNIWHIKQPAFSGLFYMLPSAKSFLRIKYRLNSGELFITLELKRLIVHLSFW
jgi:hypothetical protein